jgi:spore coat polysaccharide biosynthesis protein SpsF
VDKLVIIQARLSSTRLPGKVLKPIWRNKCLLDIQVDGLKELGVPYVLATSTNMADDALVEWAKKNDVPCFRGSEQNVLQRFIDCANHFNARHIIRVCSDNPFIQLEKVADYLSQLQSGVDYISYCNSEGIPAIKTHWGLFVEGVSLTALEKAQALLEHHPEKAFYSEHVTNFIYRHPDLFQVKLEMAPEIIAKRNDLRFTIDTEEDFKNMSELLKVMEDTEKTLEKIIETADNNPLFSERMQKGIRSFSK